MGRGWMVELVTQPAQSPDLNVNVLGFFASLKSRVWEMNASSIDELVETIFEQYEEYDGATLERVWQSLFKVYNQTLRKLGDNDFSVEHTRVSARQMAGMLERVVNMIRRPSLRPGTIWRRALVLCFLTCFGGFLTCFFFNVFWSIFLAPAAILQDF